MFGKVLVANRGEIAVRVLRTLRELGIRSVAVYSDADRASLHVRMADEAAHIGAAASSESYLNGARILDAAKRHGAEAIHPGYGFLSENAAFARACREAGIVFIGPPAEAIEGMGSKTAARQLAIRAGVPVVPGVDHPLSGPEEAVKAARRCGYPVMLKAAAGGGGKGMRRVDHEDDLPGALRDASSEAERAFRNGDMYLEKLIEQPRHIEIQLLGDQHGNMVHLGERECSLQRRHQKVLEECPSPLMATRPELRHQMGEAAIRAAKTAGYYNAGTVEFLVDVHGAFYFLEMNTRLQVEHPVTELVTGLDLVRLQLDIAAGGRLPFTQEAITWKGSAVEARIYAEDPDRNFFPCPGTITSLSTPSGPGIRHDCGVYAGWTIPLEYDPMLAKLAVWAETRDAALARLRRALDEYQVGGVRTNLGFFRRLAADEELAAGLLDTGFLPRFFAREQRGAASPPEILRVAALAAALSAKQTNGQPAPHEAAAGNGESRWKRAGRVGIFR